MTLNYTKSDRINLTHKYNDYIIFIFVGKVIIL